MRNVWTICRRELYSYFVSPIAWVLLTVFAFLGGCLLRQRQLGIANDGTRDADEFE